MIYSKDDVQRILDELYKKFVGRLSQGEDALPAKILLYAKKEIEKKL